MISRGFIVHIGKTYKGEVDFVAIKNGKILLNALIPLPPLEEQKEIVKILDSLLAKEKQVKEIAEEQLKVIDDLKKNLLTRAFAGLLGTNDPNEENSIELLKTVL